jgi:hypothetical protein
MNRFIEHHARSIRFVYSCFDRILFNAFVPAWQCAAALVGWLSKRRGVEAISRSYLRHVSQQYHDLVRCLAEQQGIPLVQPPKDVRRDEWVTRYYRGLREDQGIAVILRSREPARIATSHVTRSGGYHIVLQQRFVDQFYFYIRDREFGRMFIRMCPYVPFNARILINGHEWLANQMQREGIGFRQHRNAFLTCTDPERLQQLADSLSPRRVIACAQRWLSQLAPPLIDAEEHRAARDYHIFFSQTEYCTNIIFRRRAALDRMAERLLDLNRDIGRPDRLTVIFGRRITRRTPGGCKTQIIDHHLGNPVIRAECRAQSVKQYVRDHLLLRSETTCYNTRQLNVPKALQHMPALRATLHDITQRYLDVQQDILESFIDHGQFRRLREPTIAPSGRRTPGLKLDDPRILAVMRALTRFAHIANGDSFRTRDLLQHAREALGNPAYTLNQLRYDLGKLRAKGLVARLPKTQRYRLTPEGFRVCVLFLKLAERVYQPLTAACLHPFYDDDRLTLEQRSALDRHYTAIDTALSNLMNHLGLRAA